MRLLPAILFLMLVVVCAAAQASNGSFEQEIASGPDIARVEAAVAPIRLDGEAFAATPAKISGERWVYLVYLNASQAAVVDVKKNLFGGWEYTMQTGLDEIAAALRLYYIDANAMDIARGHIANAHSEAAKFNPTAKEEAECRRLLGIGAKNCSDYDSCMRACYSSTSFCQPIALDEGKAFIMDVWKYENLSDAVREKYALLEAEFASLNSTPTASGAADYRRAIQVVLSAQEEYSKHRFIGLICKAPSQNIGALLSAQKELDDAKAVLSPLEGRNSGAQAIADGIALRLKNKARESKAGPSAAGGAAAGNGSGPGANGTGAQINLTEVWAELAKNAGIGSGAGSTEEERIVWIIAFVGFALMLAGSAGILVAGFMMKKRRGI